MTLILTLIILSGRSRIVFADTTGVADIDSFNDLTGNAKYIGNNYRDNYSFDIEKVGILDSADKITNKIANVLFMMDRILAYIVICIFYYAMSFDVGALISPYMNSMQSALNTSVFKPLFPIFFGGTACIIVVKMFKRDMIGTAQEFFKIIFLIILSFIVVNDSATALSSVTNVTKEISVNALINVNKDMGIKSSKDFAADAAGVLWVEMVHRPWVSMEFAGAKASDDTIKEFLSTKPDSKERKALVAKFMADNSDADNFDKSKGGWRIAFSIIYFIPFILKAAVYLMVALIQVVFQVMAVFYLMLAMVILLLAMIPSFGMSIVGVWLKKLFETQINILIITFLMALLIKIDDLLYSVSGEYGWIIVLFLQTAIGVGLFYYKDKILNMFSTMQKGISKPGYFTNNLKNSGNFYKALDEKRELLGKRMLASDVGKNVNAYSHSASGSDKQDATESDDGVQSTIDNRPNLQEGMQSHPNVASQHRTIRTDLNDDLNTETVSKSDNTDDNQGETKENKRPTLSGQRSEKDNVIYFDKYQKSDRRRDGNAIDNINEDMGSSSVNDRTIKMPEDNLENNPQDIEDNSKEDEIRKRVQRPELNTSMEQNDDSVNSNTSKNQESIADNKSESIRYKDQTMHGAIRWKELQEIMASNDTTSNNEPDSKNSIENSADKYENESGSEGSQRPMINSNMERNYNDEQQQSESISGSGQPVIVPTVRKGQYFTSANSSEKTESIAKETLNLSELPENKFVSDESRPGSIQRPKINTDMEQGNKGEQQQQEYTIESGQPVNEVNGMISPEELRTILESGQHVNAAKVRKKNYYASDSSYESEGASEEASNK